MVIFPRQYGKGFVFISSNPIFVPVIFMSVVIIYFLEWPIQIIISVELYRFTSNLTVNIRIWFDKNISITIIICHDYI